LTVSGGDALNFLPELPTQRQRQREKRVAGFQVQAKCDRGTGAPGYDAGTAPGPEADPPMHTFDIPRLRSLARRALPTVLEGVILPLVIFYTVMWLAGLWGAIIASMTWSWGAMLRRVVRRERIPGVLAIGAAGLTVRSILTLISGSAFVYFLQPTLGTIALGAAFLVSVPMGKPAAERLASDFLPIPSHVLANPFVRRFFARVTVLWAFVQLANAAATLWLLFSQPVGVFVAARTGVSAGLTVAAIGWSTLWFRRTLRVGGLAVRSTVD
jgi:hypothetical protein